MPSPAQRAVSEALGTAFLLATVIGSGIMAQRLSGGNDALALLCNTLPTGAILTVLILILGPVSGAHFNPAGASSLRCAANCPGQWQAAISLPSCVAPLSAFGWRISCLNCRCGSSRRMSGQARGNGSPRRSRPSDFVDHSRLPGTCARRHCLRRRSLHYAYWFTASTSFANPAVTIARALSDTFAGIAPTNVLAFIFAQLMGALGALLLARWLWTHTGKKAPRRGR